MKWIALLTTLCLCVTAYGEELKPMENIANYLQDISVTIKSNMGTGSGVIVTREVKVKEDGDDTEKVNFVWTAAHVVDSLRSTREVVDPEGRTRTMVEFKDAKLVKELSENGRKIGEIAMDASVVKYSDADNGEDLALLMVRKRGFIDMSAEFYLEDNIPPIGTDLFHVGSLLGQAGANSMTTGIVSQLGRVLQLGNQSGVIFDQTTATAFPGSSGGGVFLNTKDEHHGQYIGMLVRGAGEGFNLIVPVRRMRTWAEKSNVLWAMDKSVAVPTLEEIRKIKPDDSGIDAQKATADGATSLDRFPFLFDYAQPKVRSATTNKSESYWAPLEDL